MVLDPGVILTAILMDFIAISIFICIVFDLQENASARLASKAWTVRFLVRGRGKHEFSKWS